jgi:hypothetical protein
VAQETSSRELSKWARGRERASPTSSRLLSSPAPRPQFPSAAPSFLSAYLLIYLPACLPACLPVCLPTYVPRAYGSVKSRRRPRRRVPAVIGTTPFDRDNGRRLLHSTSKHERMDSSCGGRSKVALVSDLTLTKRECKATK